MTSIREMGPWAVVTGASSGLGRAFAEHLARAGVHVVLAARSTDRLADLGRSLSAAHGVEHRVVPVDLRRRDGASTLAAAVDDLDVGLLISNAGAGHPGPFLDQQLPDLHERLTLNATTHLDLAHAFGSRLVARGGGGMVLVSALGATHGIPFMAHESASKAYVASLGEALHHELRPHGVRVLVALPGNVDTPIIDAFGLDRDDLPVRPLPPDAAVAEILTALLHDRSRHVPGRAMRLVSRSLPRSLSIRINGRMLGRAAQVLAAREAGTGEGPVRLAG
jgi:uncharacterized protein